MRSLQSWLTTSLVVTLVVLFALIWVAGSYAIGRIIDQQITTRLEHDMEALAAALRFDADGRPLIQHDLLSPVFRKPFSGHYFRIAAGAEVVRSRSLWDQDLPSIAVAPGEVWERRLSGPRGQELLVLDFGLRKQQRDVTVSVAEDLSPAHADITRLQWRFAVLAATLLLTWIAIQRWLVRRGLRTLEQVGDELIEIQHGRKSSVQVDVAREISPLVEQINRLTRLTAERLQRHRTAVGNLAHALKTPLTVLTRLADDASLDGEVRAEIRDNTRRISGLIDRELKRARMAGETGTGGPVSWRDAISDLVETLKKIHRDKALQVDVKVADGAEFSGDRDDLVEVLANLLDNAFKWARTEVSITVSGDDDQVILTVEDDGPGRTEEQIEQLARRGHRIDESTLGHGLGLSIVAEIVSLYRGEIVLGSSSSLGGFQAVVKLPRNTG